MGSAEEVAETATVGAVRDEGARPARVSRKAAAIAARWMCAAVGVAPAAGLLVAAVARRWMDEDAFINLRVVRNLLLGHGLVFNVGERVEATTSPLWLALLTVFGALGLRLEYAAVFGGIALTLLGVLLAQDGALSLHPGRRLLGARAVGETRLAARWGRPTLPIGASIVAAIAAVWDYASSGLETGLCLAWLGTCFLIVSRRATAPSGPGAKTALLAAVLGLGPLIRPEFALYSAAFLLPFTWATVAAHASAGRGKVRRCIETTVLVTACAGALPLAYQVFRMGYYACAIPNTALAKEAFLTNWPQGVAYFDNFFGTYRMAVPLLAAGVIWITLLADDAAERRWIATACAVTPVMASALHVFYLVRLGGDYMHGRLLIPALFAALLPVMAIPIGALQPMYSSLPRVPAIVLVATWVVICAARLRVGTENVKDIGDERSWYVRETKTSNPVTIESFHDHFFAGSARTYLHRAKSECPPGAAPTKPKSSARCRTVFLDDDKPQVAPAPSASPLRDRFAPEVSSVLVAGAIGVVGYMLPADLHIVDENGLSDPIVGRFELPRRGRPGHEKTLPDAWLLGRFARPDGGDDPSVAAARHALHCGALADLEGAITGPMTATSFVRNLSRAWAFADLRIPRDPFEAEQLFCKVPARPEVSTGGGGGRPFRWLCRGGSPVVGLRVAYKPTEKAISQIRPLCRPGSSAMPGDEVIGPAFGAAADDSFDVTCPPDSDAVGIYGRSDDLVRSVGMVCRQGRGRLRSPDEGVSGGHPFERICRNARALGFVGRSGDLVDALGVVCDFGADGSK